MQSTPFVSVCTPTFNRRPFIKSAIECFKHQTYPADRMEWIVVDDGTDPVGDLFEGMERVKYVRLEEKLTLGKKRNLMHEHTKGDIIVYMDDDDYYPPDRVEHAVVTLLQNPNALCAGASEIYIWFKHISQMWQFGPYGPNHATAGTFAFKRAMIEGPDASRYSDDAALAEERDFLKGYTVPFVQLDPMKTILVFSHEHNTFDKRKLLDRVDPRFAKESPKSVDDFVKEAGLKKFFMHEIEAALESYAPGRPAMKPDVLAQIIEIEEQRRKDAENMAAMYAQKSQITVAGPDGQQKQLAPEETVSLLRAQQSQVRMLNELLDRRNFEVELMRDVIVSLKERLGLNKTVPEKPKPTATVLARSALLQAINA